MSDQRVGRQSAHEAIVRYKMQSVYGAALPEPRNPDYGRSLRAATEVIGKGKLRSFPRECQLIGR